MPDLPTITVTQVQADRMIAAFADIDKSKTAVENYRAWLKRQIIAFVISQETSQRDKAYNVERESFRTQAESELQ